MIDKPIKAVLFDLDGTLIDSEYFYFSNWAPILLESFGFSISFEDWIREYAGHTLSRNVDYLKVQHGIDTTDDFMWNATRANYAKSDMRTIRLMPFAKEILDYLKGRDIRIGLVTSSYLSTVDIVLGHHGLLDYFEFFVTRELVQTPKPAADPYLLAIAKLGLPKEDILAIEDTSTGLTAAKAAGLKCIAVSKHETERIKLFGKTDLLLNDMNDVILELSL